MRITLIKNNIVENVVECTSLSSARSIFTDYECKETTNEQIGDEMQNGAVKTHATAQKITIITKTEFLSRFTDQELAAIYTHDTIDVAIKILLDKVNNADDIDLTSAELLEGLNYLYDNNYLSLERMLEIVS